jgi:thymidylate synthase ThyX
VNQIDEEAAAVTGNTVDVLDHGFLALDGALASDLAVVNGARVSFNVSSETMVERDEGLIRFLMRDRHGSPFEHGYFRFIVKAPLFVVREHHRHRAGHCLPGSAAVWAESVAPRAGRVLRKRSIAELYRSWHNGISDGVGPTRLLSSGRGPSLRVLNEETQRFELGRAADVFRSGTKEIYELHTDERALHCSADHRVLTAEGWVRAADLRRGDWIATSGKRVTRAGRHISPSLMSGIGAWVARQRMTRIRPLDRCHLCGRRFLRDDLVLDHLVPVATDLRLALDVGNLAPTCKGCHRTKAKDDERFASRTGTTAAVNYVSLTDNPVRVAEEETYDIEMEGRHHNFVADGVVVHNSYNEWSGRYSKLEAEFYVPDNVRTQIGKPGAYSFEPVEPEVRERARAEIRAAAEQAFAAYERMLEQGVAKEVARVVLPLSLYTKYFWSCNPRSLMHFCSLRNSEHAQYEIREYAKAAEGFLERLMPVTHAAFVANGRLAP